MKSLITVSCRNVLIVCPEWTGMSKRGLGGCAKRVLQVLLSVRNINRHTLYNILWYLWNFLLCISQFQFLKPPIPPSSIPWAVDILNVELLKSLPPEWRCSNAWPLWSNAPTLCTHEKNKLNSFLTYGVTFPTLILPVMWNVCSLGCIN